MCNHWVMYNSFWVNFCALCKIKVWFYFFAHGNIFFQHYLLKGISFSHCVFLALSSKTSWICMHGFIPRLSILFLWPNRSLIYSSHCLFLRFLRHFHAGDLGSNNDQKNHLISYFQSRKFQSFCPVMRVPILLGLLLESFV